MCGIFGFHGIFSKEILIKNSKNLNHRGPDDYNYYYCDKNKIFISHSRLAIIDIENGKQPMISDCKNFCITFNGEIYNAFELRRLLISKGYKFKTINSDTEVLINGFKEWREKLCEKINGMFSFAIYDKKSNKLFLARDRFGQKPLFYGENNNNFYFSSEIRPLFLFMKNLTYNKLGIAKSFAYGFIPRSETIYKNIFKIQPGSFVDFCLKTKKIIKSEYWKFRIKEKKKISKSAEVYEEFEEIFSRSIKRTLISDVPVGIFLSGGVDSSIISYEASKINASIRTFNISFSEYSFDEKRYADIVSNFLNTDHYIKKFGVDELLVNIDKIFEKIQEPILDPSLLPTFYLSKFTSNYVKVALSGDGADELFGGYDTFRALKYAKFFENVFSLKFLKKINNSLHFLPISKKNMSLDFKLRRGVGGLGYGESLWNPLWLSTAYIEEINELFNFNYKNEEIYSDAISLWKEIKSKDLIEKTSEFYCNFYLSENILVKTDRASMLNSLETRSPFLDNEVVNFAQTLPSQFKINKKLLKETYKHKLPDEILFRKKKGFGIPLIKWLDKIQAFQNKIIFDNFNLSHYENIRREHGKKKDHRLLLWSLFIYGKLGKVK